MQRSVPSCAPTTTCSGVTTGVAVTAPVSVTVQFGSDGASPPAFRDTTVPSSPATTRLLPDGSTTGEAQRRPRVRHPQPGRPLTRLRLSTVRLLRGLPSEPIQIRLPLFVTPDEEAKGRRAGKPVSSAPERLRKACTQ